MSRFVILGAILSACSFPSSGQSPLNHQHPRLILHSLDSDGVILLGSHSKEFTAALNPARDRSTDILLPYTQLLQNNTDDNIIAYAIRWECKGIDGNVIPKELTLWNFDTYRGGNAIAPHSSRLVSSVPGIGALRIRLPEPALKSVEDTRGFFDRQESISVLIDLIVFESGRVIGPDVGGWRARLKAHLDAESRISSIVRQFSSSPDALIQVLRSIRDKAYSALSQDDAHNRGVLMAAFTHARTYDEAYALISGSYADQLLDAAENRGVFAMMESVNTSAKKYPQLHLE